MTKYIGDPLIAGSTASGGNTGIDSTVHATKGRVTINSSILVGVNFVTVTMPFIVGGDVRPLTSDGAALGSTTKMFSDLYLANGAVINFNAGDVLLTHTSNTLSLTGGSFTVPTQTPSTVTAAGIAGTITWDTGFVYICTATNQWKRVAIASW